jgi:type II secretory pathway pseudopilin PulG
MKLSLPNNRTSAFNLIELLLVLIVVALIGVFVVLPQYRLDKRPRRINCVNNLKQIGLSFRLWAGDNGDRYPMQVLVTNGGAMELAHGGIVFPIFQVMSNELGTPKVIACPADTKRIAATNFTTDLNNKKVSYFVGLDADETNPQMLLAGDRNLTTNGVPVRSHLLTLTTNSRAGWTSKIHQDQGDVSLADGAVLQVTIARLQELIERTGVATNRLVLPRRL